MEITIKINGQAVSVAVTVEVYEYLDQAEHKDENLAHEQRRHWDIAAAEGVSSSQVGDSVRAAVKKLHKHFKKQKWI